MKLAARTRGSVLRRIEAMSVRTTARYWSMVPPDLARRLRPRHERVGDALLTFLPTSESLRMNRVIGLGHSARAEESMIDEIVGRYRAAGIPRFGLLMSPGPQAESIAGWLMKRGFERGGGHMLLLRDGRDPVPRPRTAVRVVRAAARHADSIMRIQEESFGMPVSRRAWVLAAMRSKVYEYSVALVGRTPVAAGAARVERGLLWLGAGATLTRWRRRGAHAALIAARLRSARRRGCRWAWVETAMPAPGRPDGSRRNLLRMGFEEICEKPGFVWR